MADITDRLENLRENLTPEMVRRVAAFRAWVGDHGAEKHQEKNPAFAAHCREVAELWRQAAES